MSRTTRKDLDAIVDRINEAAGYDPESAGKWGSKHDSLVVLRGYAIEALSPGDGVTRYRLHWYDGAGSGVNDDCAWSYSLGAAEFYGKLVAFLRGIQAARS